MNKITLQKAKEIENQIDLLKQDLEKARGLRLEFKEPKRGLRYLSTTVNASLFPKLAFDEYIINIEAKIGVLEDELAHL